MMRINLVTLIVYFFYSIKTNEMNKFKGTMQCNAMQKKIFFRLTVGYCLCKLYCIDLTLH